MPVMLSGILIEVSPEQPANPSHPMLVTLSGIVIEISPEQPANPSPQMCVTPSGIVEFLHPKANVELDVSMMALQSFRES